MHGCAAASPARVRDGRGRRRAQCRTGRESPDMPMAGVLKTHRQERLLAPLPPPPSKAWLCWGCVSDRRVSVAKQNLAGAGSRGRLGPRTRVGTRLPAVAMTGTPPILRSGRAVADRPPPPSGGTSTDPGRRHRLHLRVGMATSREDSVVAEMGSNGERCPLPVLVGTHHAARCERRTRRVCPPNRILLSGTPSVWKLAWRAVFPLSLQPAPARTIPYTFLSVFFRWSPALALVSPNEGRRSGVTPLTDWRYGLPRRPAPRRCGRRPRLLLSWPLARGGFAALCLLLQRVPVEGCVWRMEGEGPGGMERVRSACLRCLPSPAAVRPRMACHQGRANPPWVCSLTERRLSLRPVPAPHPHSPHKARRPG